MFYFVIIFIFNVQVKIHANPGKGETRTVSASRVISGIKIDGILDEEYWISADIAGDFSEYWPDNIPFVDPNFRTEVRVLYSNSGIYIGARMHDPHPDSILRQVTKRDQEGVADLFTIKLNPYNDAQQEFIFKVTAAGVQIDELNTIDEDNDKSWDAIWMSSVSIDDSGWTAEIKIPYSALRFPKSDTNDWSVNFLRHVRRNRKTYSWVFIDRNSRNQMIYNGLITNIKNISPPVRFFLIPYASTYVNIKDGHSALNYKAGADVKWGISSNFTLDAVLVPDFGQTAFDNVEYVLGPFEQEFKEKRPFFTEGLELFNKGELLYSRRIGQVLNEMPELSANESIAEAPAQAGLINAVKISGRTSKGLGIGISNAITDRAILTIVDNESGNTRTEIQTPLTNYNIIVLDQRYGENNSLSFVNTNVLRSGSFRDANVSALLSDIVLDNNRFNIKSEIKYSHIRGSKGKDGIWLSTEAAEIKGKHRYGAEFTYVSRHFDINDLGILFQNNFTELELEYDFRLLQSTSKLNSFSYRTSGTYRINNESRLPELAEIELRAHMQNRENNYTGLTLRLYPFRTFDHYEPRTPGRYMQNFRNMVLGLSISPNYNKKFLVETWPNITIYEEKGMWDYRVNVWPRYRLNDKVVIVASSEFRKMHKNRGFVANSENDIVIGRRDRKSLENTLSVNFNYNPKSSAFLMFRHYWLTVKYIDFFTLSPDGKYISADNYSENSDFSFNNWNIDIGWNYWFAPGSQLSLLYRHSTDSFESRFNNSLSDNLSYLFSEPQTHSLSLRISYFLDYNEVRNAVRREI